jgi:serine/threonine protein kinase
MFKVINVIENTKLMKLSRIDNQIELEKCYDAGSNSINYINSHGESALIIAAKNNIINNVLFLLSCPHVNIYLKDKTNKTFADYLIDISSETNISRILSLVKVSINDTHDQRSHLINAMLIKIPFNTYEAMDDNHLNILLNDDLSLFEENLSFYKFSAFLLACQYNAVNIIRYCIEQEFGLNYLSEKRYSGFTYLVYNEQLELAQLYIDRYKGIKIISSIKDYYGKLPLSYNSGKIMNSLTLFLLSKHEDPEQEIHEFKNYKMSDFDIIKYKKNNSGSYGVVAHAIERSTGRDVAIKSMKDVSDRNFGDENVNDFFKEICYMKHINSHNKHITPEIYGIIYENGEIKVVMEYLYSDLDDLIIILHDMPLEDKIPFIKELMRNIIIIVDYLTSLGIIHGDVKANNFMIDRHNRLKIIDFGLSSMYGINSTTEYDKKMDQIFFVYPPDYSGNYRLYTVDGDYIDLNCFPTNLTYDVFSIGVIFSRFIFGTNLNVFSLPEHDKMFFSKIDESDPYRSGNHCWTGLSPSKILEFGGEDLWNLLIFMLSYNSKTRYYAKECLLHKYFSGNEYIKEDPKRILRIKNRQKLRRITNDFPIEKVYFDEIHQNYIDYKLLDTSKTLKNTNMNMNMYYICADWLLDVLDVFKTYRLDHVIGLFNHIWRLIIEDENNIITKRNFQSFACAALYMTDIQYLLNAIEVDNVLRICNRTFTWYDICRAINYSISYEFMLNITSVEVHISYLILELQKINFDQIQNLEKFIIKNLIKWSLYNNREQCTVWELICNLTHIYMNDNLIVNERVTNILTDFDTNIYATINYVKSKNDLDSKISKYVESMY